MTSNNYFEDRYLSWEARGMLQHLRNNSDKHLSVNDLMEAGGTGKEKVRRILKELENRGYIEWYQTRKPDGSFGRWEIISYDTHQNKGSD